MMIKIKACRYGLQEITNEQQSFEYFLDVSLIKAAINLIQTSVQAFNSLNELSKIQTSMNQIIEN